MHASARPTRDSARPPRSAAGLAARAARVILWIVCVAAGLLAWTTTVRSQAAVPAAAAGPELAPPPPTLDQRWTAVLRELAASGTAAERGQAALALARAGDPADLPAIRQAARDDDPAVHVPATIALGFVAVPGIERLIARHFDARAPELRARSLAAAIAWGILPAEHPAPARAEFLARVPGGSYRQNREHLACWLLGVLLSEDPDDLWTARFLVEDEANHIPELRLLALHALVGAGCGGDETSHWNTLREDRDPGVRRDALGLLEPHALADREIRRSVEILASDDPDAAVRVAALELLARGRVFAALDRAADALEHGTPEETAVAARMVLAFGGHELRRALEERVLAPSLDPDHRAAMLHAWDREPSAAFADALLALASDDRTPGSVACAAANLVARTGDRRVVPVLRDALEDTDSLSTVSSAIDGLARLGDVDLVLDAPGGSSQLADRLGLLAGRADVETRRILLEAFERGALRPADRARCLRAWNGLDRQLPRVARDALPDSLRSLLFSP